MAQASFNMPARQSASHAWPWKPLAPPAFCARHVLDDVHSIELVNSTGSEVPAARMTTVMKPPEPDPRGRTFGAISAGNGDSFSCRL